MDTRNISNYFNNNVSLFVKIIKNFNFEFLNNPLVKKFIASVASKTDTAYNKLYGGDPVEYSPDEWNDSFTDDFWTTLLLFNIHTDSPGEIVHLGWMFGRLAFLTPSGPKPFSESKAVVTIKYGDEIWAECTIRDRRNQLVEFSLLGEEQKKDDIPYQAFLETLRDFGSNYSELINIFHLNFPISTSVSDLFIF
jgi:hypothetical protein